MQRPLVLANTHLTRQLVRVSVRPYNLNDRPPVRGRQVRRRELRRHVPLARLAVFIGPGRRVVAPSCRSHRIYGYMLLEPSRL